MPTTQQKLDSAQERLAIIGNHKQDLFHAHQAARAVHAEIRQRVMNSITGIGVERQFYTSTIFSIAQSAPGYDFASIAAIITAMEADPEIGDAIAEVSPVMADIAALEVILAAEQHEIAQAEAARREEIEIARAEALAEVEARFAEPEPDELTEPPKPFRGKVRRSEAADMAAV